MGAGGGGDGGGSEADQPAGRPGPAVCHAYHLVTTQGKDYWQWVTNFTKFG